MHISISGQQMEVSTALREHVTKKMNCISHHFAPVTNGRVGLHVGKNRYRVDATILAHRTQLHATASAMGMYAEIGRATNKLHRQIIKCKETIGDHHRGESLKSRTENQD